MTKKRLDKQKLAKTRSAFLTRFLETDDAKQYLLFSRFMQTLFIPEGGWFADTGSFKNVNATLMSRIMEKVNKHPWLWQKLFMIEPDGYCWHKNQDEKDINFTPDAGKTKEEAEQIRKELDKSLERVTGGIGGAKSLYQIKTIKLHEFLRGLRIIGEALNMSAAQLIELEAAMLTYIGRHFPDNAVNIGVADKDVPEWYQRMLDGIMKGE